MSESTTNKQRELLSTQENVENNPNKNSTLINMEKIKGTPFTIVKNDTQYFLVMGDYRLTEPTNTRNETLEKLESEYWLLIMHICIIAVNKILEHPTIQEMEEIQETDKKEMEKIQETDKKWESPREKYKNTHQQYNPIK